MLGYHSVLFDFVVVVVVGKIKNVIKLFSSTAEVKALIREKKKRRLEQVIFFDFLIFSFDK